MTRRLDEAIETLRDLPEDEQDAAVSALFAYISSIGREAGPAIFQITANAAHRFGLIRAQLVLPVVVETRITQPKQL